MALAADIEALKSQMQSKTPNGVGQAQQQQQQRAMNGSISRVHRKKDSKISSTNPFHSDLTSAQNNNSSNTNNNNNNNSYKSTTMNNHNSKPNPNGTTNANNNNISNRNTNTNGIPDEKDIASQKEANLKRQQLVEKQLREKAKRLRLEQEKLSQVNSELKSLENKLAKDVSKLREMIDAISYDISWYEKDHEYKKKQYLDSLKNINNLKERRTKLTEHLHTIISTNEQRKSEKLAELMNKLEVTSDDGNSNKTKTSSGVAKTNAHAPQVNAFSGFPDESLE